MSEYPEPWHHIDPEQWAMVERCLRKAIHKAKRRGDLKTARSFMYRAIAPPLPDYLRPEKTQRPKKALQKTSSQPAKTFENP